MTLPKRWIAGLAALCLAGAVHAGRPCNAQPPTAQTVVRGLTLAERTQQALQAEHARAGTQVVVLARAGQDLSAHGLRYSHLGWAYRTAEGNWRVVHKLNHCGTATAALYRQGLGEFFLDDLWRHEAAWAVPTPEVQVRLLPLLRDTTRVVALHEARYNLVSYPWSVKYQQSNQWAIETLALAMEPGLTRREQAQAWLRLKAYEPTTLRLGPFTRLGARASAANVAFDDHPNHQRFADRIETVTVDSVFAWLPRAGLGAAPVRLALP